MQMKSSRQNQFFFFCLLLLCNPNIHILDILPDFLAWGLLWHKMRRASYICPYFSEARQAAGGLCLLNLLKVPALALMLAVRAKNTADTDVVALCALIFGILELIFLIRAAQRIFTAVFYLGERTEVRAILSPFTLPGGTSETPESVRALTMLFFGVRSVASFAPELLLLSTENGNFRALYPYALAGGMLLAVIVGILWFIRTFSYVRAIQADGGFETALSQMEGSGHAQAQRTDALCTALSLFAWASLLGLPLTFSEFGSMNLLGGWLYAGVIVILLRYLQKSTGLSGRAPIVAGLLSLAVSLVSYICLADFLSRYGYDALLKNTDAQAAYRLPMGLAPAEGVMFCVFFVLCARWLCVYVRAYTGMAPTCAHYDRTERNFHRQLCRYTWIWAGGGMLHALCRAVNALLRAQVRVTQVNPARPGASGVIAPTAEWFGVIVFLSAILFIFLSFWYFGILQEQYRRKVGEAGFTIPPDATE